MTRRTLYCFDLDGTVTDAELLPLIAAETDLEDEITALTRATIDGTIPFDTSFRLRCRLLADVPVSKVRAIAATVPLNDDVVEFIRARPEDCTIATGNLDLWVEPILDHLGCRSFTSTALAVDDVLLGVDRTLYKADAIEVLREDDTLVVAVGDGMNDVPMFEAADVAVAFGGVHPPADAAIDAADFVAMNGAGLCQLLTSL